MKWNKKHIILAIFLPIQILLMKLVAEEPAFIEHNYSNGIYPTISSFFRIILGWIPFSVGDLLRATKIFTPLRNSTSLVDVNSFQFALSLPVD